MYVDNTQLVFEERVEVNNTQLIFKKRVEINNTQLVFEKRVEVNNTFVFTVVKIFVKLTLNKYLLMIWTHWFAF